MIDLLDGNVLIALADDGHVSHESVVGWFVASPEPFATTPTTQGTLLRHLIRSGQDADEAIAVLTAWTTHERHVFWPDDAPYDAATMRGVIGHRQVTDAYLVARARAHGGRVATLDLGLRAAFPDDTLRAEVDHGSGPLDELDEPAAG
ncbi:MAG: TA system VapC family ribonuclease toxin [Chloroflexota bacterium]